MSTEEVRPKKFGLLLDYLIAALVAEGIATVYGLWTGRWGVVVLVALMEVFILFVGICLHFAWKLFVR